MKKPTKKAAPKAAPKKVAQTPKATPAPATAADVRGIHTAVKAEVDRILKSNRWYFEHPKESHMTPKLKSAIAAALTANNAVLAAILESEDEATTLAKPAPAEKPAKAPKEKPPTEAPKAADQLTEARNAVVKYAETHGREATRAILDKFTRGTVADVPAEKLPELIAAVKAAPAESPLV